MSFTLPAGREGRTTSTGPTSAAPAMMPASSDRIACTDRVTSKALERASDAVDGESKGGANPPGGAMDYTIGMDLAAGPDAVVILAGCPRCRGIFDVTYDDDTRAGRCPGCAGAWRAKVLGRLLRRGWLLGDAFHASRRARRRWP